MHVLNPDTMQVIKTIPQAGGADVVAFDPGLGLVYAFEASAKGFDVYDANTMEHLKFVSTGIGQTHTGDVNPTTHLVYAYAGNDRLVEVYNPTGRGPVVAAAQPSAVPTARNAFLVFFEFDKANLTEEGARVVAAAVNAFKTNHAARIELAGYTDLSGTQQYNLALSKRRAEIVQQAVIRNGVPAKEVGVSWHGKENPRVPTPDGVREPQNRRVEIVIP